MLIFIEEASMLSVGSLCCFNLAKVLSKVIDLQQLRVIEEFCPLSSFVWASQEMQDWISCPKMCHITQYLAKVLPPDDNFRKKYTHYLKLRNFTLLLRLCINCFILCRYNYSNYCESVEYRFLFVSFSEHALLYY